MLNSGKTSVLGMLRLSKSSWLRKALAKQKPWLRKQNRQINLVPLSSWELRLSKVSPRAWLSCLEVTQYPPYLASSIASVKSSTRNPNLKESHHESVRVCGCNGGWAGDDLSSVWFVVSSEIVPKWDNLNFGVPSASSGFRKISGRTDDQ